MPTFSVVLVEPKYQKNIGSVARVMKNFNFKELVLINPPDIGSEARAMAMHGRDILQNSKKLRNFQELKKRFDFLVATTAIIGSDRNALRTPVTPEELRNSIHSDGRIALIFGREDYGLFNSEIEFCDLLVSIPTNNEYPTLNLSHAVTIVLYEISRLKMMAKLKRLEKFKGIRNIEKNVLLKKFDSLTDKVYKNEFKRRMIKKTFRQLIGRAFLSRNEAFTLTGLFRRSAEMIRKNYNQP